MEEKIKQYLIDLEKEKNIKILLAVETGSRAWGFPSPDSDYDIRFIYLNPPEWYISLNEKKDTIEKMYENRDLDLSGWDFRKSLHLLWKSNASLLEKIQSPIIYLKDEQFASEILRLSHNTYSKIAVMHHYLSMSKNMYFDVKDKERVKLKKLFYALRTAVACKWILDRDTSPPIVFPIMLEQLDIPEDIKTRVFALITLKSTVDESYLHTQELEINLFIEKLIAEAEQNATHLPHSRGDIEDLNVFYRSTIFR
jgi:uncharacterized protein